MFIRLSLLITYGGFLIALSAFKTSELFLPQIYQFEAFLGGDKWMHFKLSSLLAFMALMTFSNKSQEVLKIVIRTTLICLALTLGLLVDELHQSIASTRRFEWLDFLYGFSGIGLGVVCFLFVSTISQQYQLRITKKTEKNR